MGGLELSMLKPIYIYKFKTKDEVKSYIKYFIVDSHNPINLDKFIYLTQFNNYDELFINLKVNKDYEIVEIVYNTKSIECWYADVEHFSLIEFYDLIYLLEKMIEESNIRSGWPRGPKLVELLQLIIAKWDDWN
jgi:hypothetical protein